MNHLRNILFLLFIALLVAFIGTSCKTTCPAYKQGRKPTAKAVYKPTFYTDRR